MKYYLAYGSNLNVDQMKCRCPDAKPAAVTKIPNYHLLFRRGFLTIEPQQGSSVPVVVWKISDQDEKSLDRYEGYPKFYRKEIFPILLNGYKDMDAYRAGKRSVQEKVGKAMVYIMTDGFPAQQPSSSYLETVKQGYATFKMDVNYLMNALVDTWEEEQREKGKT